MQDVLKMANVKKDKEKTFFPLLFASEFIIFSTANNKGINATKSSIAVYGIGGQASQAINAVAIPKI